MSVFVAALAMVASSAVVKAQSQRNTAEVAVGGGYAYLDTGDTSGTVSKNHGVLDASVSYNVLAKLSVGFEYTFSSLASESQDGVSANVHLNNYGALLRFGLVNTKFVMPYVSLAGGGLDLTGNATDGTTSISEGHHGGYLGVGLGANGNLGHGFGIRPEVRYERQQLSNNADNNGIFKGNGRNEITLTGTLFYTFGGHRK